ncbi:DUF257 family protein [Palaeococcus ferrophilus]|uniref:DUF257 family protein n=1 Tax=Palaeococcus ferrophilus TaxID=83868 RepID=UPI00064F4C64|nr:DUF257 family protein [Palaeococcus ferrophilus]
MLVPLAGDKYYTFKPGESLLIEYSSDFPYYLVFYYIMRQVRRENIPVIIDDVGDALSRYAFALEVSGLDTSFLEDGDVYVIKLGGKRSLGNVIGRIELESDFYIHSAEYSRIFGSILGRREFFVNFVLGFETRFLVTPHPHDRFLFIASKLQYTGNEKRAALYLVNRDILEGYPMEHAYIREMFTSLVQLDWEGEQYVVRIVRSPEREFMGTFTLPREDFLRIVRGEGDG